MIATMTRALIAALVLAALPSVCLAQSDDDANGAVQFNFSTPGARSLALGGAFVGAADDATAAYANPAGLFQLSEPEVSIEARRWSYSTAFADRGRLGGSPTGIGDDTIDGVVLDRADDELDGLSFASFVYPKAKWAFALYYHQVANFESNTETNGIFLSESNTRLLPVQSSYSLDISQIGAAVAFKWGRGSAGLGVSSYSLDLTSLTQRFDFFSFGPPDFGSPRHFQRQTGEGDEIGFTAGIHYEAGPKTRVGLVYRYGPEFDVNVFAATGIPANQRLPFVNKDTTFDLPDIVALGISHRPSQRLTVNADLSFVSYSQLVRKEDEDQLFVVIFPQRGDTADDFFIDDALEARLGVEYVFDQLRAPLALRAGAWWDPDHRLRYEGDNASNLARLFAGDDELHWTAGLGLVIGSRFQLDLAADLSDSSDVFSLSTVIRF